MTRKEFITELLKYGNDDTIIQKEYDCSYYDIEPSEIELDDEGIIII